MFNVFKKFITVLMIAILVFIAPDTFAAKKYSSSSSKSSFSSRPVSKPSTSTPRSTSYNRPSSSSYSSSSSSGKYKSSTSSYSSTSSATLRKQQDAYKSSSAYATINTPKPTTTPKPYNYNQARQQTAPKPATTYSGSTTYSKPTQYKSSSNTTVVYKNDTDMSDIIVGAMVANALTNSSASASTNQNYSANQATQQEIAQLKSEVAALKQKPIDRSTLPHVTFCTGQPNQNYYNYAAMLNNAATAYNVDIVETNGSIDNLNKMSEGKCDVAIVQRDSYKQMAQLPAMHRISSPYADESILLCRATANVYSITDLTTSHRLSLPPSTSGTVATWSNLSEQFSVKPTIVNAAKGTEQLFQINEGKADCAFIVSTRSAKLFETAKALKLHEKVLSVHIPHSNVEDIKDPAGDNLYYPSKLSTTGNFSFHTYKRFFGYNMFRSDATTIIVPNDVVVSKKFMDTAPKLTDALIVDIDALKI